MSLFDFIYWRIGPVHKLVLKLENTKFDVANFDSTLHVLRIV